MSLVIIDDELEIPDLLSSAISATLPHLEIFTFKDPEAALEFIKKNIDSVTSIISDERMPKLTGRELLNKVVASGFKGNIFLYSANFDDKMQFDLLFLEKDSVHVRGLPKSSFQELIEEIELCEGGSHEKNNNSDD